MTTVTKEKKASTATAISQDSQKKVRSSIGAPSQRTQGSRKGKRAWRKNVDIDEVEEALEEIREEERVVGTAVQKQTDEQLFYVDQKGDEQVRKTLPRFSTSSLTSAKILAQRSAVPAVFSRPSSLSSSSASLKRKKLSHEEKGRLLQMGKRLRRGPLNSYVDPTEMGSGSAMLEVSEAVKNSGGYDIWMEGGTKGRSKRFVTPHPRQIIELPAVPSPHEGASYNPTVSSHQELLRIAHTLEEQRVMEAERLAVVKEKISAAVGNAGEMVEGVAKGMTVDVPQEKEATTGVDEEAELPLPKKPTKRKTTHERRKQSKLRAQKRALAEMANHKRLLASVDSSKSLRKKIAKDSLERTRLLQHRKLREQEKLRQGLAGQKLGKHVVKEGEVEVQLGEDLSESLRGLKPEGNLFRDRFLSMQQRALVEPRAPVLPRKQAKTKEYEKHAFKRFDRDN